MPVFRNSATFTSSCGFQLVEDSSYLVLPYRKINCSSTVLAINKIKFKNALHNSKHTNIKSIKEKE